jgi:2,3-bisphosphoglycerate-independent phosphoglycerate mutase
MKPMVVIVRDGWGCNPHGHHAAFDAVREAHARGLTPVADSLMAKYPWTLVKTSGLDVGVPPDQTGNSELGHQNIGAGRIVDQEVVRISKACNAGEFASNEAIAGAIGKAVRAGKAVHLMGIASDAGVHGLLEHLYGLVRASKKLGSTKVYLHLFTDGRDTPPTSGRGFIAAVEKVLKKEGLGRIATLAGRYYAMDRDFRWERVKLAYDALVGRGSEARRFATAEAAISEHYENPASSNLTGDEFLPPRVIGSEQEVRDSRISSGDAVIFYNYRGDRPREISMAFILPDAQWAKVKPSPDSGAIGFDRGARVETHFVAMTAWAETLVPFMGVAFGKPPKLVNIAGEVFSKRGLRQFRCAETEKFPHVTFFFNDYREEPFPGEVRGNPQSPRVATYDLKPEMAAFEVRDMVLARLSAHDCEDVIIVNFANCDMVGHTGNLEAAITAVGVTDQCVGDVVAATLAKGGELIVTADHGNAEQMWDPEAGCPHTAHTMYDVPLIVVGERFVGRKLRGDQDPSGYLSETERANRGRLADVMPTLLAMMGIDKPAEMSGTSLLLG